jgi:hypothetical protein
LPILRFISFTLLTCPPNVWWQGWLERQFPSRGRLAKEGKGGQSPTGNTARKFLLDQSVGALVNTLLYGRSCCIACADADASFLIVMSWLKGSTSTEIRAKVNNVGPLATGKRAS